MLLDTINMLGKRLLIKLNAPITQTKSGILLNEPEKNENLFTVMRIGPEVTQCKEGDTIVVGSRYGDEINLDGVEYKIITEDAILMKSLGN